jgi:hypothetical protein
MPDEVKRRPSAHEIIRQRRKLVALRRAEFRLRQRFDAIDFEIDVIKPEVEALDQAAAQGELPEYTVEDPS